MLPPAPVDFSFTTDRHGQISFQYALGTYTFTIDTTPGTQVYNNNDITSTTLVDGGVATLHLNPALADGTETYRVLFKNPSEYTTGTLLVMGGVTCTLIAAGSVNNCENSPYFGSRSEEGVEWEGQWIEFRAPPGTDPIAIYVNTPAIDVYPTGPLSYDIIILLNGVLQFEASSTPATQDSGDQVYMLGMACLDVDNVTPITSLNWIVKNVSGVDVCDYDPESTNPIDCVFTWGEWSPCVDDVQTRSPIIIVEPAFGGQACPASEMRACSNIMTINIERIIIETFEGTVPFVGVNVNVRLGTATTGPIETVLVSDLNGTVTYPSDGKTYTFTVNETPGTQVYNDNNFTSVTMTDGGLETLVFDPRLNLGTETFRFEFGDTIYQDPDFGTLVMIGSDGGGCPVVACGSTNACPGAPYFATRSDENKIYDAQWIEFRLGPGTSPVGLYIATWPDDESNPSVNLVYRCNVSCNGKHVYTADTSPVGQTILDPILYRGAACLDPDDPGDYTAIDWAVRNPAGIDGCDYDPNPPI